MEENKKTNPEKSKKNKEEKFNRNVRIAGVVIAMSVCFLVVAGRLFYICIVKGEEYTKTATSQSTSSTVTLPTTRGDILDSNGIVLATSNVVYNLILDAKLVMTNADKYQEPTVDALVNYFGFTAEEINEKLQNRSDSSYVILKKKLTYNEVADFLDAKNEDSLLAGIWLEESSKRNYTFSSLACSVLGFTQGDTGIYGLEQQYNDELTGTEGRRYSYIDDCGVIQTQITEAVAGKNIQTTIDSNIQSMVEDNIKEFLAGTEAKTVACIIQDPNTGAILAMADSDDFDCNNPYDLSGKYTEEELDAMSDDEKTAALSNVWTNFCITQNYEPGSTAKPFTLAAGFEENAISMEDTWDCIGYKEFTENTVKCHENSGHGTLTTPQALAESCNVALMNMAEKIGIPNFCKYQAKYGFGKCTDIDLPNEADCASLMYNVNNMTEIDLATNSFGQNFNVTMIQLSTAFCSLINGGYYYKPYVVKSISDSEGNIKSTTEKTLVARTISQSTSDKLKECLRLVVADGTGDYANIDGYVISGKTGTGEKAGREAGKYVVSFIGFAPYTNPDVVCYVVIDEPENGDEHGVSSTLFNMIMSDVLPYMNITSAENDYDPYASMVEVSSAESTEEYSNDYTDYTEYEENAEYTEEYVEENNYFEEEYIEYVGEQEEN